MLIYDISSNCVKAYEGTQWTGCLSQASSSAALVVDCAGSTITGIYTQTYALTAANTITIKVTNNTFSLTTVTPATSDIVFSGTGAAGITVASVTGAVTPAPGGGSSVITYSLSGTPTTVGAFTATWTKLALTCAKASQVCPAISPIAITNILNPSPLPLSTAAGNTVTFTSTGGIPNTGLTWAMTSYPATGIFTSPATGSGNTAVATLAAGASGVVTVTYTAVNACGLTVINSQTATVNATYVSCATSTINGIYTQGVALTAANTITMQFVNNDVVAQTIPTTTGDLYFNGPAGAGLIIASASPASLVLAPNGGTGTITYGLSGTPTGKGAFTAVWNIGIFNCTLTGAVCANISAMTVASVTNPTTLPSPTVAGNTITYTATGGTPNTGQTWALTSIPAGLFSAPATGTGATAVATLVAGATGTVTATFTSVNACGLSVISSQIVNVNNVVVNCAGSAINGAYTLNSALTSANTITMLVTNQGTSAKTVTPATGDIVFSGTAPAGITVASVSAPVSISASGTSILTYTLGGTPTATGTFTATWSNLSMTCAKTSTVCTAITPITVSNVTSPTTLPAPTVAGNTITFTAAGGTPNTGLTWAMTSSIAGTFTNTASGSGASAVATLAAAASGSITVTYTATNACGVIVTGTQTYNFDALRSALVAGGCASCTAYDNAAADTWVQITAAEYAQIDNFVTVNIAGCNETVMTSTPVGNETGGTSTYTFLSLGTSTATVPTNNYVIAFSALSTSYTNYGPYLKYSTSNSTGFSVGGPILSLSNISGRLYNIMKKPSVVINASSPSYVAIFTGGLAIAQMNNAAYSRSYSAGDIPTASTFATISQGSYVNGYQVKATATKKW